MNSEAPETLEGNETPPASAAGITRQWPFLIAVFVLIAAAAIAAIISGNGHSRSHTAGSPSATTSSSATPIGILGEATMTRSALLRHLAQHVSESAADRTVGIYTHITIVQWVRGSDEIAQHRLESWHTPDGRLRVNSRAQLPAIPVGRFDITTADPASLLAAPATESSANDIKLADVQLPAGANPLQELTVGLQHEQPDWLTATASVRIDTIVNLYRQQYLSPPLRAAALQLLADQGEFTHQRVTDHVGRPGIAFTLTADATRWTLVVEQTSGQLLAYERWTVSGSKLDTYALILTVERTDRTPAPASPTPASTITPTGPPTREATAYSNIAPPCINNEFGICSSQRR